MGTSGSGVSGRGGRMSGTGIRRRRRAKGVVYEVRYRDPAGVQRSKSFDELALARRFLTRTRSQLDDGSYVSPAAGRVAFGAVAEDWYSGTAGLKIRTRIAYRSALDHNLAGWHDTPIADLTYRRVQELVNGMVAIGRKAPTVRNVVLVARHVFDEARKQQLIRDNPCVELTLPRLVMQESNFLSRAQVQQLAAALPAPYDLHALTAVGTGLRAGELAGLRVQDLDLARLRLTVRHSVTYARGQLTLEAPKTTAGRRTVPLARPLARRIADLVADASSTDFVFGIGAKPLWHNRFYLTTFKPAVLATALPPATRFHDLRHTYASQYRRGRAPQATVDLDGAHLGEDHDGSLQPPLRRRSRGSIRPRQPVRGAYGGVPRCRPVDTARLTREGWPLRP